MRYHMNQTYRMSDNNNNNKSRTNSIAINYLSTSKLRSQIKDFETNQQSSHLLQSPEEQHLPQKCSINILVVDDETDTLFTYESFLSGEGYNVKTFIDPIEALKHFVQLPDPSCYYNLALLDIRMPKLNGLQLFYKMKMLSPKIKIMFCSALDIAEELTSMLPDIKHEHIIKKPVDREYFIHKVNSALNKQ